MKASQNSDSFTVLSFDSRRGMESATVVPNRHVILPPSVPNLEKVMLECLTRNVWKRLSHLEVMIFGHMSEKIFEEPIGLVRRQFVDADSEAMRIFTLAACGRLGGYSHPLLTKRDLNPVTG